jgi:Flp pilus assembly protein TadG
MIKVDIFDRLATKSMSADTRMTTATHRTDRIINNRGQEVIELAILLPLLLLISFGVLDLGRLYHAAITISNAAREGVRYGTFYPSDVSGIIAATEAEAQDSSIDLSTSLINVDCPEGCGSGLPIRVTVTYDFRLIMGLGFPVFPIMGLVFPDPNLQLIRFAEMMVP